MNKIFNKNSTREKRKILRKNQTEAENKLWQCLRNKKLGVKFRRQHGIGEYIADFYCTELKLVIEVDGSHHYTDEGLGYDEVREEFMSALEIKTIRFSNKEIIENIYNVISKIKKNIEK